MPPVCSPCWYRLSLSPSLRHGDRRQEDHQPQHANAYKVWLQGIDQQPEGKPAYASYIVPRSPRRSTTQVGVSVSCAALQQTRA